MLATLARYAVHDQWSGEIIPKYLTSVRRNGSREGINQPDWAFGETLNPHGLINTMATQTRTWQRKTLEQFKANGYSGLYWYIEIRIALNRYAPACYPGLYVPVVPVAPDPEITQHWAHLIAELFKDGNETPSIQFEPQLASTETLRDTGCWWYVFGERVTVDVVCRLCGCIEQIDAELLVDSPAWICADCANRNANLI